MSEKIGALVVFLLVLGILHLVFGKIPVKESEIEDYIYNSETIVLSDVHFYHSEDLVQYGEAPWRHYRAPKSKSIAMLQSPDSKKCFVLEAYGTLVCTEILSRSKLLYVVVNRDDMNNPELGSKEHPVPVLLWHTHFDNKFCHVSKEAYRYGVKEYLTFCRDQ